jgi:hypothetical protein
MTKHQETLIGIIKELEQSKLIIAQLNSDSANQQIKLDALNRKLSEAESRIALQVCTATGPDGTPTYTSDKTRTAAIIDQAAKDQIFSHTIKMIRRSQRKIIEIVKQTQILEAQTRSKEALIAIYKL